MAKVVALKFKVNDVVASQPDKFEDPLGQQLRWRRGEVVQTSPPGGQRIWSPFGQSEFFSSVLTAFDRHYPLRLNPNVFWFTVMTGFGTFVSKNVEALRSKLVGFKDKEDIIVMRNFSRQEAANDWAGMLPDFVSEMSKFLGPEMADLAKTEFSTTTPVDKAAFHVAAMHAVKEYFNYIGMTGCGIPSIELTGSVRDWEFLAERTHLLRTFQDVGDKSLMNWLDALEPVLAKIVEAARGNVDARFWDRIAKRGGGGSGGVTVTGWILALFPYVHGGYFNPHMSDWDSDEEGGLINGGIPDGLAAVDFKFIWDEAHEDAMQFVAGPSGVFWENGAVEAKLGWAVLKLPPAKA